MSKKKKDFNQQPNLDNQETKNNQDYFLSEEERLSLLYYDERLKNKFLEQKHNLLSFQLTVTTKDLNDAMGQVNVLRSQRETDKNKLILDQEIVKLKQEMQLIKDKVETRLKIKMVDCSFDPEVGKLTILPNE